MLLGFLERILVIEVGMSGDVCIDSTDIGMSDHFLVWLELGRIAKNSRKQKHTIRRWRLDKFGDDVVREKYCEALQAEVEAFSEGISQMEEGGMRGNELVEGVRSGRTLLIE